MNNSGKCKSRELHISKEKISDTPEVPPGFAQYVSKLVGEFSEEMKESPKILPRLLDCLGINELTNPTAEDEQFQERHLCIIEDWLKADPQAKNRLSLEVLSYIRFLREKVKERREWANEKFVQSAQKLSYTLLELKLLRQENMKSEDATFDERKDLQDKCLKLMCDKDDSIIQAKIELERANENVRMLEQENSAIRAEIGMCKMNSNEHKAKEYEFQKLEKKHMKRIMTLQKQCRELDEQLLEEKNKELKLKEEAIEVKKAILELEVESNEELKQLKLADALVLEEHKFTKIVEANIRRNQAMLDRKLEIECYVQKDEKQRLEEELSNLLKTSGDSSCQLSEGTSETNDFQDTSWKRDFEGRVCVICSKSEAFVLFLPCLHQVTCLDCNERNVFGDMCPHCKNPVKERVCVFGARK